MPNLRLTAPRDPRDWVFGQVSGAASSTQPLNPSGDWTLFTDLVFKERQWWRAADGSIQDGYYCVTISALHCIEFQEALHTNESATNHDEHFTAVMSGTVPRVGNSLVKVAETIRQDGIISQRFDPAGLTEEQFYAKAPADRDLADGQKWLASNTYSWEWVNPDDLSEALKHGPVQATINNGFKDSQGRWLRDTSTKSDNHAVCLLKKDALDGTITYLDSYEPFVKRLAPGYRISWMMLHKVTPKNMYENTNELDILKAKLKDNTLVQLTEPGHPESGNYGLYLNGKILLDPNGTKDLACSTYLIRTAGKGLSKHDWDLLEKMDFKGNKL